MPRWNFLDFFHSFMFVLFNKFKLKRKIVFFKGLFFVFYVVNGLKHYGYVLNVLDGHVFHFFYLHFLLVILWYV